MKKIYFIVFLISITYISTAQENKLFKEVIIQKAPNQADFIMNFSFDDLDENNHIKALQNKSKNTLNSISSCIKTYVKHKKLKLSENEINTLKSRVTTIAERFYNTKRYALLKSSGGMAPIYGIDIDTIAKKQVFIVLTGGDCIVTEEDNRWEEITNVFNTKMKALLNKK